MIFLLLAAVGLGAGLSTQATMQNEIIPISEIGKGSSYLCEPKGNWWWRLDFRKCTQKYAEQHALSSATNNGWQLITRRCATLAESRDMDWSVMNRLRYKHTCERRHTGRSIDTTVEYYDSSMNIVRYYYACEANVVSDCNLIERE